MNPGEPLSVRSEDPAGIGENIRDTSDLWEAVFSRQNLMIALKRVERNRGAAGADGLRTDELRAWCLGHWTETREALDAGTYAPLPVRQVMIPKPDGGERKLGVPSVLDRLIQQAVAQVPSPVFDPGFVPVSYGFRPGRSAHDAVKVARTVISQGYRWVVEVDLDAFFDRVNHDVLMARVARKVKDKRLLKLIRRYLEAGIMADGVRQPTVEGTPQGSPLSPLLSNIMLDDFDQEFWGRGHRFVRYADDIRVFVKSRRAAERVLDRATKVLETGLKLRVNRQKSTINPASVATLLGFGFYFAKGEVKIRIAPKAFKRMKDRIRELTSRKWSISMADRIQQLNRYVRGWMGYFRLSQTPRKFSDLDEWFRRRMRQIRWKEWKRPRTRVAKLRKLGIRPNLAYQWGMTSRAYWRIAGSPILQRALPNQHWVEEGFLLFHTAWDRFQRPSEPPYARPARTVV
ncbi:group II intron reverse transcriptase/maturase [Arthrobacter sp. SLBN-100]|uniref:group II intron reverse transcriptase/maturase n=1 Tax=Arthrobacter sp. SLBN-100 TaxID=2768450 RepID=UPI001170371D|nr:group II intron reverse transcriptase/maturase [Arthrobacter sp. SLBN-100]TQJ66546.1 group II intron reverse transcriptase/maturase [Arthrobacter sp. SLBN-100]